MPPLRPIRPLSRPSIHDLAAFLLTPPTRSAHAPTHACCLSHLSHLTHKNSPLPRHSAFNSNHNLPSSHPRPFSTSLTHHNSPPKPKSHDRGPPSKEDTQTDFGSLNVLGNTPAPSTSIDACLWDGFHLNNGVKIVGGSGVLLVAGEAFAWRPWEAGRGKDGEGREGGPLWGKSLVNEKGQWDVEDASWGLLELVWPKPDLLILGLGKVMRPISPKTRQFINGLGIRVDIQDTRNAAAQFNLLATERGVGSVAAALIPLGWKEGVGVRDRNHLYG